MVGGIREPPRNGPSEREKKGPSFHLQFRRALRGFSITSFSSRMSLIGERKGEKSTVVQGEGGERDDLKRWNGSWEELQKL